MSEKAKEAFICLGTEISDFLKGEQNGSQFYSELEQKMPEAFHRNGWFTGENIRLSLSGISHMLERDKMDLWLKNQKEIEEVKNIGIIMAGNIPIVGFHDLLSVLVSGHRAVLKLSSDDHVLMPIILNRLFELNEDLRGRVSIVERLENFDAVIATGSNNSARYFDYYFREKPHIIRKNRNSVAVITGDESEEELKEFGKDIFFYFGLGCRNVSKMYVPKNYDLDRFFGAIVDYHEIVNHKKYGNNYEYYKAFYLMNRDELIENGFLLLKEDKGIYSPVSMMFYERYENLSEVEESIETHKNDIQCVVSARKEIENSVPFGKSQYPELWDYADGVDTLDFLNKM